MKKILAASVLAVMSIAANSTEVKVAEPSEFKPLSKSFLKQSPTISAEQINLLTENQNKDSVSYVLGTPHYGTGLFRAKTWEYRFNVANGDDVAKDCSYRLDFQDNLVSDVFANAKECVDILVMKEPPVKVVEKVIVEKPAKVNLRGVERAEAQFAVNKFDKRSILNKIDWDKFAAEIKKDKPERVFLSAYTDSTGAYMYNLELASKRADTVAKELIQRGVNPSIIEINNVGKTSTFSERKVVISW